MLPVAWAAQNKKSITSHSSFMKNSAIQPYLLIFTKLNRSSEQPEKLYKSAYVIEELNTICSDLD